MYEELLILLDKIGHPRVCVIGDMMLDTYVWGRVSRVSPEGPIPVLAVDRREHRPGGAGSVAAMLCALGARVSCVGVVGEDEAARELGRELQACGADTSGLVRCADRPTTLKARYLGYVQSAGRALQQIARVDDEDTSPVGPQECEEVLARIRRLRENADLILIQDMAKGLLGREVLERIIADARRTGRPVIVDPERGEDYSGYRDATCLLPNRFEAETATGIKLDGQEAYREAARKLVEELSLESVVIKLDRDGMFYMTAAGDAKHIRNPARGVADVTGAGDMVAAVVSMLMASGAPLDQTMELANVAAGVEVTRHGAATISRAELLDALKAGVEPAVHKVRGRQELLAALKERRERGETIVFTNGCFDLLHLGHVNLIRHARRQGQCLVVGVNSDSSTRKLKGPGRPINTEDVRARVLASLTDVDYVVIFDEVSVLPLIRAVRPDVLVKGGDYDKTGVVGWELVESYGGRVELAPEVEGLSTTDLIQRITENSKAKGLKDVNEDEGRSNT